LRLQHRITGQRWFQWSIRHHWFLILSVIVLIGAVLRLRGYDFGLPYIDHPDEPNFALTAMWWRGEAKVFQNANYPPGFIWLEMSVQEIMDLFQPPFIPDYIRVLRLLSVFIGSATTLLLALTATRLGGKLAGIIAGLMWAVAPTVIESSIYATPDPWVYFWMSLALYLSAVALFESERSWFAVAGFAVGWLAIITKYPVLPAILPGGMAGLYVWWKRDRRLGWRILTIQAAMSVIIAAWIIWGFGVLNYNEGAVAQNQGLQRALTLDLVRNNLWYVFAPLVRDDWPIPGWGMLVVGFAAGIGLLRRKDLSLPHILFWLTLFICTLSIVWLAAVFRKTDMQQIRDVIPATTAVTVLWSVSFVYILSVIITLVRRFNIPYKTQLVRSVALMTLIFLLLVPQVRTAWRESTARTYPDVRVEMTRWVESSLDPGRVIVSPENHKTFNRYWGGYEGQKWFEWDVEDITERPVAEWRDTVSISYAAVPYEQWQILQQTAAGRAMLDDMLLLRTFPPRKQQRGPAVAFFRLFKPQHEITVNYGDEIRLVGYDMTPETPMPGDHVEIRLYWQPIRRPSDNYSVFMHFTPEADRTAILAQVDWTPVSQQRLPLTWQTPDEILISQPFYLDIPPDLDTGKYVLRVGLYNFVTGQRLPVRGKGDGDHIILWSMTVSSEQNTGE